MKQQSPPSPLWKGQKEKQWKVKEETNLSLFADDVTVYGESLKESTDK